MPSSTRRRTEKHIRDIIVFAALGAILCLSFMVMQSIPNIHPLAAFIGAITLTYRKRALIPIYIFVLVYGVMSGFSVWWIPYLYLWLPLWLAFMLAGRLKIPKKFQVPLYMLICALHGLSFGIMYAPAQALFFGLNFEGAVAWVIAGLGFDIVHAVSNFFIATLVVPLTELLNRLNNP